MKPTQLKQQFIELRAKGKSYNYIADKLHISKSTCTAWEKQLSEEIAKLKKEELNALYETYFMTKEAKIKNIGDTLNKIDETLKHADFSEIPTERLLDLKLKYSEALSKEYVSTKDGYKFNTEAVDPKEIIQALSDLLTRVRNGEISTEQANKESLVITNLLKAYETVALKTKLDELESIVEGRR